MTGDEDLQEQEKSGVDLKSSIEPAGFDAAEAQRTIERLQKELAGAQNSAQLATEEMQQVLYAIGHDLRAALRSVMSYSQLLRRQPDQSEQAAEFTDLIIAGATEMNSFIEDVLVYSRSGNPGRRTTAKANALVQWAVMNLEKQIRESGGEVTVDQLPEINVNESEFVSLFQQLLKNSLLFSGERAPRVDINASETGDGYLFSVQDDGIGVASQYHQQIFAPFKRLHGKEMPGRGLGLAICNRIVRAHGGEIWVESNGERGSNFKFTIPF